MRIRIVGEGGEKLPEEVLDVLELDLYFNAPFEATPTPFTTPLPDELEVKTNAQYCSITLRIGRIRLFRYSGPPIDLTITLSRQKIDSIKTLLG